MDLKTLLFCYFICIRSCNPVRVRMLPISSESGSSSEELPEDTGDGNAYKSSASSSGESGEDPIDNNDPGAYAEGDEDYDPEHGPYFQGDIVNHPGFRNGIPGIPYRWPKGSIDFFIDSEFGKRESGVIRQALYEIERNTCIVFNQLSTDRVRGDFVHFRKHSRYCYGDVGRQGGRQYVYYSPRCLAKGTGSAIHEVLHIIGFYHEQSRDDRDKYVKINWHNIRDGYKENFYIQPTVEYGFPYDYGSILHYSKSAFAKADDLVTIEVLKAGAPEIGQRKEMSEIDIGKVNAMYKTECEARLKDEEHHSYVKLYKTTDCSGKESYYSHLDNPTLPKVDGHSWNNEAYSASMIGSWIFYEDPWYNNKRSGLVEYYFSPTWKCIKFKSLGGKLSSMQVGGNRTNYYESIMIIYKDYNFQGGPDGQRYVSESLTNIDLHVQMSLVIGGFRPYTVYSKPYMQGETLCITPRARQVYSPNFVYDYKLINVPYDYIRSAHVGCYS